MTSFELSGQGNMEEIINAEWWLMRWESNAWAIDFSRMTSYSVFMTQTRWKILREKKTRNCVITSYYQHYQNIEKILIPLWDIISAQRKFKFKMFNFSVLFFFIFCLSSSWLDETGYKSASLPSKSGTSDSTHAGVPESSPARTSSSES